MDRGSGVEKGVWIMNDLSLRFEFGPHALVCKSGDGRFAYVTYGEIARRRRRALAKITSADISAAVKTLRTVAFGETQQRFADRIGSAIITLARWETRRPPQGKPLETLLSMARLAGMDECIIVFEQALSGNITTQGSPKSSTSSETGTQAKKVLRKQRSGS